MTRFTELTRAALLPFMLVAALGCDDDESKTPGGGDGDAGTDAEVTDKARVRVIHLAPAAEDVDIFVNGGEEAAIEALGFAESTDYVELDPGSYDFDVSPAGGSVDDAVISAADVTLEAGKDYTVAAWGASAENLAAILLVDDNSAVTDAVRVRAVHAADGVGEVDIWNITNLAAPGALFENLGAGEASDAAELPFGTYVAAIDADNDAVGDFGFALPELSTATSINVFAVLDGSAVTLYAQIGSTVLPIPGVANPAFVRAAHLAAPVGGVDIFVDGAEDPVLSNVTFPAASGWLLLPAGDYDFDISATGDGADESVLSANGVELTKGEAYTAYAYFDGEGALLGLRGDDFGIETAGNIRIDVVHVAPAAGQVDVLNADDNSALLSNVNFGASGSLEVPAGEYTIGLDTDNGGTPDVTFALPSLAAGTVATAYAVSDDDGVFLYVVFADGSAARIDAQD